MNIRRPSNFAKTPRCHMPLSVRRTRQPSEKVLFLNANLLLTCILDSQSLGLWILWRYYGDYGEWDKSKPTVGLLLKDLRPHSQRAVDDDKPEGDQRDKVIKLVGSVHHHTQNQHQEVQTEQHLEWNQYEMCQIEITQTKQRLCLVWD